MKIVLTVHQFLPEYCAGTEILTFHTARELQRLGHEVFIFTAHLSANGNSPAGSTDKLDNYFYAGIPVTRINNDAVGIVPGTSYIESDYNNSLIAQQFYDYCKIVRPDVVHFFHLMRLSGGLIDVCKELDIPCIFTATDFWLVCPMAQLRMPNGSMCKGPN